MPKIILFLSVLILSSLMFNTSVQAKFYFGEEEKIVKLREIRLVNMKQESLYLGRLVTTKFFILGIGIKDNGYVLGVEGKEGAYYPFLPEDQVKKMQKSSTFPTPLPPYKLGVFDYMIGYSLYWLLLGTALWGGFRFYSTRY